MGYFYSIPVSGLDSHDQRFSALLPGGDLGTSAALTMLVAAAVAFVARRRYSVESASQADSAPEPSAAGQLLYVSRLHRVVCPCRDRGDVVELRLDV